MGGTNMQDAYKGTAQALREMTGSVSAHPALIESAAVSILALGAGVEGRNRRIAELEAANATISALPDSWPCVVCESNDHNTSMHGTGFSAEQDEWANRDD